jgi:hypothetical protein
LRASGTSARSPWPPITVPSSPRVPVSASATIRIAGYPARPSRFLSFPSQDRFGSLSGTWTEFRPSNATVRSPRQVTPRVHGAASGTATVSNTAFAGAAPSRRRKSRSAFSDGRGRPRSSSAPVILSQTFRYPIPGNSVIASTKYIPTREGSARIRFCTAPVISSTSSSSSNGR